MSGPKVLRTITREELLEIAAVQQVFVDQALKRWQAEISATDNESAARRQRFLADRSLVEASVVTGRPDEIVRRAKVIVDTIDQDIDRMRDVSYVEQARRKTQARSLQFISQSLLKRCLRSHIDIPDDHLAILQRSAAGQATDNDEVAKITSHWMDRASHVEMQQVRADQQELARSLMDSTHLLSAGDLLKQLELESEDPRITTADKQIAELAKLGETQAAEHLEQRLAELIRSSRGSVSSHLSLSLDALGIEIATLVKQARVLDEVRRELAAEIAAAAVMNDTAACQQAFNAASLEIERGHYESAREQIQKAREFRESRCQSRAVLGARTAILHGLNQLGYAVHEGMDTSWADKKRLVIQHPKKAGVALEMTGNPESGRFQTRMVAVEGLHRDALSDREVETEWCSDLQALQAALAKSGNHVNIEKAMAAGTHPLKVVSNEWIEEEAVIQRRRQQERKH